MEQLLVSGSVGFIGGYLVQELLKRGYAAVGLDNFSKYGKARKSCDDNPNYRLVEGGARDPALFPPVPDQADRAVNTTEGKV